MKNAEEVVYGALYWQPYTSNYARLLIAQRCVLTHRNREAILCIEVGRRRQRLQSPKALSPFTSSGEPIFDIEEAERLLDAIGYRTVKCPVRKSKPRFSRREGGD